VRGGPHLLAPVGPAGELGTPAELGPRSALGVFPRNSAACVSARAVRGRWCPKDVGTPPAGKLSPARAGCHLTSGRSRLSVIDMRLRRIVRLQTPWGTTAPGPSAWLLVAMAVGLVVGTTGCSYLLPAEPELTPSPPPMMPARRPLGPQVDPGRIELAGSAFAITIPASWSVEVVDPDPDLRAAAPGSTWEALRAEALGGSATCSVYVARPPAGSPIDPERFPVDRSPELLTPAWCQGPEGPRLCLPRPALAQPDTEAKGSGTAPVRLPDSDPALPDGAQYVVECWWEPGGRRGEADAIEASFEMLELGPPASTP
jgi:hypothetical protein